MRVEGALSLVWFVVAPTNERWIGLGRCCCCRSNNVVLVVVVVVVENTSRNRVITLQKTMIQKIEK